MQQILDEVIEKTANLNNAERRELIQFLQEQEEKEQINGKKNLNPNIEWLKAHRAEYAGNYVALKNGELIAFGKTFKETDLRAKEKGVKSALLHRILAEDETAWGGW